MTNAKDTHKKRQTKTIHPCMYRIGFHLFFRNSYNALDLVFLRQKMAK